MLAPQTNLEPCYDRHAHVSIRRLRNCVLSVTLLLLLLSSPAATRADSFDAAVRDLVHRVVPMLTATRVACVSWENRQAISDARSLQLRTLFLAELGVTKATPAENGANCGLQVAISKTPTEIVFVAQLDSGERKRIFFSEAPRADSGTAASSTFVQMEKQLLVRQSGMILDALEIPGRGGEGAVLAVLGREALSLYSPDAGLWIATSTQPLPRSKENQRAPRGELRWNADPSGTLQIALPGMICLKNLNDDSVPLACQAATDDWRSGAAAVADCEAGSWNLQTGSGDWSETDRILLMNSGLPRTQTPIAATSLPGPVISLSPGIAPHTYITSAFNLSTGNYEVYRVTVSCRN